MPREGVRRHPSKLRWSRRASATWEEQAVQADLLLRLWRGDPDVEVTCIAVDPRCRRLSPGPRVFQG